MDNKHIEWRKKKLEDFRHRIESGQLNAFRELLPNEVIQQACEDCQYFFRSRLFTPLATVFHMIGSAMTRDGSFQSAWHMSGQSGQSGALARARKRLPLAVWQKINEWMLETIDQEFEDEENLWRGHRMIGVDGTCVSMSDEPELAEHFGRCNTKHGLSRFPTARAAIAFNLKTLITVGHRVGHYTTTEVTLFQHFMGGLKKGDVLILDRRFAGANLYASYQARGLEFISRLHQRRKVDQLKIIECFSKDDFLVDMPFSPQYRTRERTSIQVRIIRTEAKVRGRKETFWLVTSLLNPSVYPANEIKAWYKNRWKVETLIEELKILLGSDVLRSQSIEGIYKELYARVLALNLIHWLILKASQKYNLNRNLISVSAATRLSSAYSLKMSLAPVWQLPELYDELLEQIGRSNIYSRPDRLEPRMIKRDKKHYPQLKISRYEWRQLYANAA